MEEKWPGFEHISKSELTLEQRKEIELLFMENNRFLTSDVGQQLATNDKELVLLLVRAHGAEAFRKVSDELKNDKEVVMAAVAKDPNAFDDASEFMKDDPDVLACKENRNIKQLSLERVQDENNHEEQLAVEEKKMTQEDRDLEKYEDLRIETMHGMVEDIDIFNNGTHYKRKFLYMTNAQVAKFNASNISKVLYALKLPKVRYLLCSCLFYFQLFFVNNFSTFILSYITSPTLSFNYCLALVVEKIIKHIQKNVDLQCLHITYHQLIWKVTN